MKKNASKTIEIISTESQEQSALFEWAQLLERRTPELRLLFAIPNGGLRNKVVAAKLKAEGVKSGVPDVCLPVARNEHNGLFIEMKRRKDGKVSLEQAEWIRLLIEQGYKVMVCRGFDEAKKTIEEYLRL